MEGIANVRKGNQMTGFCQKFAFLALAGYVSNEAVPPKLPQNNCEVMPPSLAGTNPEPGQLFAAIFGSTSDNMSIFLVSHCSPDRPVHSIAGSRIELRTTKLLTRVAAVVLMLCFRNPALSQWEQTSGPFGGRTMALALNGTNILAGSDGGGIFVSANNGLNWTASRLGLTAKRIGSFAIHGTTIFAGSDIGLFRSTDNGFSWIASTEIPDTLVSALTSSGQQVYAGTIGAGVFKTTDDGQHWASANTSLGNLDVFELLTTASGVYAGTNGGVFFSSDAGNSWTSKDSGLTSAQVRTFATKDPYIFAGTSTGGIFRTSNGGISWDPASSGLTSSTIHAIVVIGVYIFAGTTGGVFQSINDGQTWMPVNFGLDFLVVNALLSVGPTLLAGSDGGIYRSTDNGANWERSDAGLTSTRVRSLAAHGTTLFAGTLGSGVYRSTNYGTTWENKINGLTNARVFSLTSFGQFIFAGTTGGGVFRSSNDGDLWEPMSVGLSSMHILTLSTSGSSVYCGTRSGLFQSTNNGSSWTSLGMMDTVVSSFAVSGPFLFAGTLSANVLRSANNGQSWAVLGAGLPDTSVFALAVSGPYLFAGTKDKGVFRSTNNGDVWTDASVGMQDTIIHDLLVSGTSLYAALFGQGVVLSTDNGESWNTANAGLSTPDVYCLAVVESTLFAGTDGGGVEKRSLPPTIPALVTPTDSGTALAQPILFSWLPSAEATAYHLQISLDSRFTVLAVNDSTITGTSAQVSVLAYNSEYYWRVGGIGSGGASDFTRSRSFSTPPTQVFAGLTVHVFPSNPISSTDYRVLSFPGVTPLTAGQLFTGTEGGDYRVFADNGGLPPNHLDEVASNSPLRSGEGYWVIARGRVDFSQTVEMPRIDSLGIHLIDVDPGWNIIANPFDRPVNVDALRLANADTFATFYDYEGDGGFVDTIPTLAPFSGYYFENRLGLDSMRLPYPFAAQNGAINPVKGDGWTLRIILESGGMVDGHNLLGVAKQARFGRDMLDNKEPPSFPGQPFLCFSRPEWGEEDGLFSRDLRPSLDTGQVWSFEIRDLKESAGVVRVVGIENVPEDCPAALVNMDDGRSLDLRKETEYHFQTSSEKMTFSVVIGPGKFVEEETKATIPKEFQLFQNFPNPFNPRTSVRFGVPRESHVRLEVLSVLGQRVSVLTDGIYLPGTYTYVWDGVNDNKEQAASGIYFYRLSTTNFAQTKKLVLLR